MEPGQSFCLSLLEDQIHANVHSTFVDETSTSLLYQQIDAYCEQTVADEGEKIAPLVVVGDSGVGKSAALANWATRRKAQAPPARRLDYAEYLFFHTVGCSRLSTQITILLRRLVDGLISHFEIKEPMDLSDHKLSWVLPRLLERASKRGRIVIVIDGGLQHICSKDKDYGMRWLPLNLPSNVRMILSATRPDNNCGQKPTRHARQIRVKLQQTWDEIQRRKWPVLPLECLKSPNIVGFIEKYMSLLCPLNTSFVGERKQIIDIISSHESATNPLFLTFLLRGLCHALVSGYNVNQCLVAWMPCRTVAELMEHMLSVFESGMPRPSSRGLANRHRLGSLLGDSLSLLFVARHGLHETELRELLEKVNQQSKWTKQTAGTVVPVKLKILNMLVQRKNRLIDTFRSFDTDGNGTLSYEEFHTGMQKLDIAVSRDEVTRLIEEVDSDGDGEICYRETLDHFEQLARNYMHGKRRVSVFAGNTGTHQNDLSIDDEGEDTENLIETLKCVGVSCLESDSGAVLTLPFDSPLRDTVWKKYLCSESNEANSRTFLIEYFSKQPPSLRYCEELPWHLKKTKSYSDLKRVLIDLRVLDIMYNSSELKSELFVYLKVLSDGGGKVRFDIVGDINRSLSKWVQTNNPSSTQLSGMTLFLSEVMAWFSKGITETTKSPPFLREKVDDDCLTRLGVDACLQGEGDAPGSRRPRSRGLSQIQPESLYYYNRWVWVQFPWLALKAASTAGQEQGRQVRESNESEVHAVEDTEPSIEQSISVRDKAMLHARLGRGSTAVSKLDKMESSSREPKKSPVAPIKIPFSSGTTWQSRQDLSAQHEGSSSHEDAAKQLNELKHLHDSLAAEADSKEKRLNELESAHRLRQVGDSKSKKVHSQRAKIIAELENRLDQLESLLHQASSVDMVFQNILLALHSCEPKGQHLQLEQQIVLSKQQIADLLRERGTVSRQVEQIESKSKKISLDVKSVAEDRHRLKPQLESLRMQVAEEEEKRKISRINSFDPSSFSRRVKLEGKIARRREAKARLNRPRGACSAADIEKASQLHPMEKLANAVGTRDPASIASMLKEDEAERLRARQEQAEVLIKDQAATLESLRSQIRALQIVSSNAEARSTPDEHMGNAEEVLANKTQRLDSLSHILLEVSLAILNLGEMVQPAERDRRLSEFAQITAEAARPMTPNGNKGSTLSPDLELKRLAQKIRSLRNEIPSELQSFSKQGATKGGQAEYHNVRILNRDERESTFANGAKHLHNLEDEVNEDPEQDADEDFGRLSSFVDHGIRTNQSQHEQRRANLLSRAKQGKYASKGLVLEAVLQSASKNGSP